MTDPQATDLAEWCAFLRRFGIEFSEVSNEEGRTLRMMNGGENVGGYNFFFTDVEFDATGQFVKIGAWE